MNNKQNLKKLIREMLDNWEPESSYTQRIDAMSPKEVASILKDAIKGRHASGKKYHPAFQRGRINEASESWPTSEEIERFLIDYREEFETMPARQMFLSKGPVDYSGLDDWKNLPHTVQQIIGSIFLFTGAHVASVRDPNKYDLIKAHSKFLLPDDGPSSSAPGASGGEKVPSLVDYRMANHVMTILSNRKSKNNEKVYRGIRVPNDPAFLEGLKPGIEFECWPISSFTINHFVAMRFAEGEEEWGTKRAGLNELGVLIVIKSISTGTYIHDYSYFSGEYEFVSSPKLVIEKFESPGSSAPGAPHLLYCKEI